MADSAVAITAGTGTNIDTRTEATNGDHRQVVVIGDPSVTAGVAAVTANGSVQVTGAGASGSALVDRPVLVGGSDGTNTRNIATDTSGNQRVVNPDQSASISIAANSTASGSVTGLTGAGSAIIQLTGTFTATAQVQITVDGSTWVNITGSNSVVNAATGAFIASGNLTAVGVYQVDAAGASGVRVITTAYTSGTITGTVRVSPSSGIVTVEGVVPVSYSSGTFPVSGTVTANVTGYPTAAASADGFANPTVTKIDATNLNYNGATWDRQRSGTFTLNVDTSSARTATGNGTAAVNYAGARSLTVWINVTAVSGTTPTCVFKLQWSPDNGTTWIDWDTTNLQTTSITGVTTATLKVGTAVTTAANAAKVDYIPRQVRLAWTITGTTPSFTFATWYTFTG